MIIHREITPHLDELERIYVANLRVHSGHQTYMLYQVMLDYLRYWRHIETTAFDRLNDNAQDELYYYFTEKLLHVLDLHVDLYWLIADIDGQPLFRSGREPSDFWKKRLARPELQLKRMRYVT